MNEILKQYKEYLKNSTNQQENSKYDTKKNNVKNEK